MQVWAMRSLGLWFMGDRAGNTVNRTGVQNAHNFLPCQAPNDTAWTLDLRLYP